MRSFAWLFAEAWLVWSGPAGANPAPGWATAITDTYVGRWWNAGVMACTRTEFTLRGGALVGHYWIGDTDPFEGELTHFVPATGHSGTFTWTDRYGVGVIYVRFAEDGQSYVSAWGEDTPDAGRPGYGLRGPEAKVPGCGDDATS